MADVDDRLERELREALRVDTVPSEERLTEFRQRVREHFTSSAAPQLWPNLRRFRWMTAAAAAVLAAVVGFAVLQPNGTREFSGLMNSPLSEATAEVEVLAIGIGRVISFETNELPILPTGEYYEFWFVSSEDTSESPDRISAGTFHPDPDGRSSVEFVAAVDPAFYPMMEVTAEPGDGNPAATGPVVLSATIDE